MGLMDNWTLTSDPAWPWSLSPGGLPALAAVALLLVVLTVWTYLGVPRAGSRRVLALLGLRLTALALVCLMVLRPSLASRDELRVPSVLIIVADYSESMTIQDEFNSQSRWDLLRRLLRESEPQLQQLRDEHNVSIVFYQFAGDVREFDPQGKADGKRTDFGEMLHSLYERHAHERFLRGLLVLSDGADNGTRHPALALAAKWRGLPCPIHTFAFGQTTTAANQRDIAFSNIIPDPSPVNIKGKLAVKGILDAPGFVNANVQVHLFIDDKEVVAKQEKLLKPAGNEVQLVCDAPAQPGEIKVTLKMDPVPGELSQANNEISTYVTVLKEGLSVLYVEGKYRAWEPKFIRYALSQDPRIRLYEGVRVADEAAPLDQADLFQLDKQHYDVIILGDISAKRLSAGNPQVLAKINELVRDKGAGLIMIGGYETFGNGDWANTDIAKLLPVYLDVGRQVEQDVQMVPTPEGLRDYEYVLRLADKTADTAALWAQFPKLPGMTKLGEPKPGATVLARSDTGLPMLVAQQYGKGRTLAFAADTTERWRNTLERVKLHARFWQQVVLWLARQDEAEGSVRVKPDLRRLAAGSKLGFSVDLRGKNGAPAKEAQFEVKVVGPQQAELPVPTAREHNEERGTFWKTDVPGEYQIRVRAWGTDADGNPIEPKDNYQKPARFLVYDDDAERVGQVANHDFLQKLAGAGGGKFHRADELPQFLQKLQAQPLPQSRPRAKLWPDWRRTPPSSAFNDQLAALAGSGILACFLLFVVVLCLEWLLRRYWGLV
jgi:uncharacterized membrane protein